MGLYVVMDEAAFGELFGVVEAATDVADAGRVVIVGDGAEHHVELVVVDGWPERIFFTSLPAGAVEVRLEAEDGRVLLSTTV